MAASMLIGESIAMKWSTRTKSLAFIALKIDIVSIPLHAEFGLMDHREDALHFIANLSEILVLKIHPVQTESTCATKIAGNNFASAFRLTLFVMLLLFLWLYLFI